MIKQSYKLPRIYLNNSSFNSIIELSKMQSSYLTKVMRLKVNDKIRVFNGKDGEFLAEITEIKSQTVFIQNRELLRPQYVPSEIILCFSLLKNNRTDYIIEKATELGVTRFQPLLYERSIVKSLNIEKIKLNIIEAAEQCERLDLPLIEPLLKFNTFCQNYVHKAKIIYFSENEKDRSIMEDTNIDLPVVILVGPEGGFSSSESEVLNNIGIGYHLGPRILRSETAAIVGLALIQSKFGDFNLYPRIKNFNS